MSVSLLNLTPRTTATYLYTVPLWPCPKISRWWMSVSIICTREEKKQKHNCDEIILSNELLSTRNISTNHNANLKWSKTFCRIFKECTPYTII